MVNNLPQGPFYNGNVANEAKFRQNMIKIRPYVSDAIWQRFLDSNVFREFVNSLVLDLMLLEGITNSPGSRMTEMHKTIRQAELLHFGNNQ